MIVDSDIITEWRQELRVQCMNSMQWCTLPIAPTAVKKRWRYITVGVMINMTRIPLKHCSRHTCIREDLCNSTHTDIFKYH